MIVQDAATPGQLGTETVRLLPLAITRVDDGEACVGAVDETGRWLRPEPVLPAHVTGAEPVFRYWHWTELRLGPSTTDGARVEDRAMVSAPVLDTGSEVPAARRRELLTPLLGSDVASTVGSGRRSLGLIRAEIRDVYLRRSTGGRTFVRCRFADGAGAEHDWIVPEIAFGARVWSLVRAGGISESGLVDRLGRSEVYLTLGLTMPNNRFPGQFGGCHPLVVGVHVIPEALLAQAPGPTVGAMLEGKGAGAMFMPEATS
jgi:hypothetical protein